MEQVTLGRSALAQLREEGLVDPVVLAVGLRRGWIHAPHVADYAAELVGTGHKAPEIIELAACGTFGVGDVEKLLSSWSGVDIADPQMVRLALRRWMYGFLTIIWFARPAPAALADAIESLYWMLDLPAELRECSDYATSHEQRERLVSGLVVRLAKELGIVSHRLDA